MTNEELITAVREHAIAHYVHDGWDYVVECWERTEIEEVIIEAGATTIKEAIAAVGRIVSIFEEQRFEAHALSGHLEHYNIEERDGKLVRRYTCNACTEQAKEESDG